jgi:hypothetical protein
MQQHKEATVASIATKKERENKQPALVVDKEKIKNGQ